MTTADNCEFPTETISFVSLYRSSWFSNNHQVFPTGEKLLKFSGNVPVSRGFVFTVSPQQCSRKTATELRSKWIFQVTIKGMLNPDLTYFIDWLSNIAFVHVELSLQFSEKRFPVNDKVTTKSFNVQALAKSTDPVKLNYENRIHKLLNCTTRK